MSSLPDRIERRDVLICALLVLIALAARLAAWGFQEIVSVDGTTYIRMARYLFGGPLIVAQHPPGYPFFIGVANLIWNGDGVNAAKSVDLFFGVLVMVPFYALALRLAGRLPAVVLTAVFALTPLAIRYSVTTMTEIPFVFFLVAAALAAHLKRDFGAGALTGIAFLIRPEGLVLAPALGLARGWNPRAWILIAAGAIVFGAVPSVLYNHQTTGAWTLTQKIINITGDDFIRNEVTPERTINPGGETSTTRRLLEHRDAIARVYPERFKAEIVNLVNAVGWGFPLAALAGILFGPRFAACGLAQAVLVPMFPGVPPVERLVLPLLPFTLLLAAGAVRRLGGKDRPWSSWKSRAALAVLVVAWGVQVRPQFASLSFNEDGFFPELVQAGKVLAPSVRSDQLMFCRKPYTAFYAGTRYQTTPLGDYHKTIDAIVQAGGDYLVVDQVVCEIFRPALLPLVLDSATMFDEPRLEIIYFDPSLLGRHVAVYRVLRPGGGVRTGEGRELERVLRSRIPHDPTRHRLHAELAWLSGKKEETVREFELAIAEDPDDVWNLKTLAGFLLDLGERPERALELAEKAALLNPGDPELTELQRRARAASSAARSSE